MNPNMLANPAVARNLSRLREDGWEVLEPEEGHMACGVNGRGRFPAPQTIADRVRALLAS
jgi:phosphopantothenoylcysteine decarboxylase/phosphopantothenate--cysteine ligase